MDKDPYRSLADMMQRAAHPAKDAGTLHAYLGTVLSASPLKVDVAGTTQTADHFYLADRLRQGHAEQVAISGLTDPMGAVDGDEATLTVRSPVLQAGDLVLLLTTDDQIFYLLDKVVHL